jgi:hypothetical protein
MRRLSLMDDELTRSAESLRRREQLEAGAARLRTDLATASARAGRAYTRFAAEQDALRRLSRRRLSGLLGAGRGAREEILLRKQADVRAAHYLAVQAQEHLARIQRQLDLITDQLAASRSVPADYAAALTCKEQLLRRSGQGAGPRLDKLAERRQRLLIELCDLQETADLADTAAAALQRAADALDSTAGWSAADLVGGGAIISMIKENELDDALDVAAVAEHHLSALRQRVTGMPLPRAADGLSADAFTRFADITLDNALIDLSTHRRITTARDQADTLLWHLCEVRAQLAARITAAGAGLYHAEAERAAILRS